MTQIRQALAALLEEVDRATCRHERTYRVGAKPWLRWTLCRECSTEWADDRGGFVPYADSPAVAMARAALAEPDADADADAFRQLPEHEATLLREYGINRLHSEAGPPNPRCAVTIGSMTWGIRCQDGQRGCMTVWPNGRGAISIGSVEWWGNWDSASRTLTTDAGDVYEANGERKTGEGPEREATLLRDYGE